MIRLFRRQPGPAGIRRHDGTGRTWTRPRPADDADVTRILGGIAAGRHTADPDTPREHLAIVRADTRQLTEDERAELARRLDDCGAHQVADLAGLLGTPPAADRDELAGLLDAHRRTS